LVVAGGGGDDAAGQDVEGVAGLAEEFDRGGVN